MAIDDRGLSELIVESQDLQSDAMRDARTSIPLLREIGATRDRRVDPSTMKLFNSNRRSLLRRLGLGGAGVLAGSALSGTVATILSRPAAADSALDIQILQTASSLERLAVATYDAALGLPFIKDGNATIVAFAKTTMSQHDEHKNAFQSQTKALGGKEQDTPNPKYGPVVDSAKPGLKAPIDVVKLAATLEEVARDTYLADLSMFEDNDAKTLMATVMGVETQHLATLRAVGALLEGGGADLIRIPTDVAKLPAAAGSVGFDDALYQPTKASPPAEGALK
ncbi:MAG TPA: ferritin-like domain-containing protein [Acidimicrobiales bacterium]|nr:ferritin-like domain-containing protein [Acidimicrobiales bacterium]